MDKDFVDSNTTLFICAGLLITCLPKTHFHIISPPSLSHGHFPKDLLSKIFYWFTIPAACPGQYIVSSLCHYSNHAKCSCTCHRVFLNWLFKYPCLHPLRAPTVYWAFCFRTFVIYILSSEKGTVSKLHKAKR